MAITQADIDALERAIATGALEVQRGDEKVRYRSLAEMRETLSALRANVQGSTRGPILRPMTPRTNRGV